MLFQITSLNCLLTFGLLVRVRRRLSEKSAFTVARKRIIEASYKRRHGLADRVTMQASLGWQHARMAHWLFTSRRNLGEYVEQAET